MARAARIELAVTPGTIPVGGQATVTATALDSLGRPVLDAGVRLESANPSVGIVTRDSVGTGAQAGTVFGTLHALSPASFSVTAESRDRSVFAQIVVVVTRAGTP